MSEKNWLGQTKDQEKKEEKKGKPTWKPSNVIDVIDKEPGFRYRLIEKSPKNLAKKEREGWEILSGVNTSTTSAEIGYGRIDKGKPLTSVLEGIDYIVGRIPEELAEARDEYQQSLVSRSVKGLKRQTQTHLGKEGATVHGNITLEQNGVRTVIE